MRYLGTVDIHMGKRRKATQENEHPHVLLAGGEVGKVRCLVCAINRAAWANPSAGQASQAATAI